MQAGGRLVEHVDGPAGRAALQLRGQLDALRLAAGQRGGGLAEPDVAEADLVEGLQVPVDRRDGLEERRGLLDRHVEDLGDRLALVMHLEGVGVVPGAVADLARDVDVGQELHLDLDRAVAGACLAPAALHVEREPALLVPAHLGLSRRREQLPDVVEDTGIGRGVGPRGAADRPLVDVHDLVQELNAGDLLVLARNGAGLVQLAGEHVVQDVVDQGGLA